MSDIASRLERYARAALDPAPGVLEQGRLAALAGFAAVAPDLAAAAADRPLPRARRTAPRARFALALGTLVLLALGAGAVAASGAGGPLYGARLDVEALTLPNPASSAWIPAQVSRLDARITEVQQAATAADPQAVAAAVSAYQSILAATLSAPGRPPGQDDVPPGLLRALDRHEALLAKLAASAPPVARTHISSALDELQSAIAADTGKGAGPGTTNPPGKGRSGGAAGTGPGNGGNANGAGAPTPHPRGGGGQAAPGANASPSPSPSPAAFAFPGQPVDGSVDVARTHVVEVATRARGASDVREAAVRTERRGTGHGRDAPHLRLALAGHAHAGPRHAR